MGKKIYSFLIIMIAFTTISFTQNDYEKKFIKLTPGVQYEAGWLHELIFGAHWRDLWTTPINVEVLDLHKFAGGLTPLKRGGGFQTKSLRLTGNDGNIWKFRSMAKDPAKVLPEALRKTFVADVFQDQISSANPLAALVAAPILEAVDILQAKPYLIYMPDDPKLGEYREDFGGELGMIEINPDVDDGREFEGADKIKSTFKLLDRLAKKTKEKINTTDYLKARLVDILLGDWDRHTDQWKWARYDVEEKSYWKPIPRDRDQVFAKWDGIGPTLAEYITPQFVHFDYDYPPIEDITWSGRYIDRRFLTELTRTEWDSVASFVVNKLTDQIIEAAVATLPAEHYDIVADEIIGKLKTRRNSLADYAKEYYNLINKVVDIYGSDKDDITEITRLSDFETNVEIYELKKKSKIKKSIYNKVFDNSITKEIRIYQLDGDDKTFITGEVDTSPLVRVIGGEGKDELVDSSKVNGYLFGLLPIPHAERNTEFYDSGKKTKIVESAGTYYNNDKMPVPKDFFEKYEPALRNRSVDWLVSPVLGYNSFDGLRIGGGAQIFGYNFRMDPYEYWMNATVDYATNPQSFTFNFNGIYNSLIRGTTVTLDISRSELLFTNYYGFGNETTFDQDLEDVEFYRIDEDLFSVKSAIYLNYFGNLYGSLGLEFKTSKIEVNNKLLLSGFNSTYGLNGFNQLKLFLDFNIDTRDNSFYPESGFYANLRSSVYPQMLDNNDTFFKTEAVAAYFATLRTFTDLTLAFKVGGGTVFGGDYPFFESIFIGGANDLRGFSRRRFAGDHGAYGQFELRSYLFPIKIIFPGRFGVHGFIESGRVYDDIYENSKKWHPSYGGGIWMTFIEKSISLSLSLAESSELDVFYFTFGMGF
jgi:Omp85 superfamily domain